MPERPPVFSASFRTTNLEDVGLPALAEVLRPRLALLLPRRWRCATCGAGSSSGLGPVGGRIVAETFAGLMAVDRASLLHTPRFRPDPRLVRDGEFGFQQLVMGTVGQRIMKAPPRR